MSASENGARGGRAMSPELGSALDARVDGVVLGTVYDALPVTDAGVLPARREAAWAKLQGRLHDPTRVPFTDDVRAPLELVRNETPHEAAQHDVPGDEPPYRRDRAGDITMERAAPHRAGAGYGMAAAASLLLAFGTGTVWANGTTVHRAPSGGAPQEHRLGDGTRVWVAPGSALSVPRRLGWPAPLATAEREAHVEGEAFFDVQRDGRPFVVSANGLQVRVLGTRFTVRGAHEWRAGRVEVNEGRVAVLADGVREELAAGEGVSVQNGRVHRFAVAASRVAAWRTGGLAALDEPLGDVLAELSRRYAVEIEVDREVNVSATVSLFYAQAPAVEVVIGDLCTAQGLGFEKTSRGYRIVQP
jgi:ferric-dicitrate binding protein FerR (iron transport regulator)